MNMKRIVELLETVFLVLIAIMTVIAMGQEIWRMVLEQRVALQDLLLMFIYAEVLGMVGAYYTNNRLPIALPLFIAITALARMIVLQGKELDPSILIYESGSILLIAIAWWVIRRTSRRYETHSNDE